MLKEFSETRIFFLIIILSFSSIVVFPQVYGALYSYDETEFSITWTDVLNGVATYNSTSGEVTIYSQSVSGATHTFTRVLGNDGVSTDSVAIGCTPGSLCSYWDISVRGDILGLGWGSRTGTTGPGSTTYHYKTWNMTDGTETSPVTGSCSLGGGNALYMASSYSFNLDSTNDYMGVMAGQCNVSGSSSSAFTLANGTTLYSSSGGIAIQSGGAYSYFQGRQIIFENGTTSSFTGDFGHTNTVYGNCDYNTCGGFDSAGAATYINFGDGTVLNEYTAISPDIPVYRQGVNVTDYLIQPLNDNWIDNLYDYDNVNQIVSLSHIIFEEDDPTGIFLFTSNGIDYVGKVTTTGLSYALQSDFDFTNKAVQNYIADTPFGNFATQDVETVLPTVVYSITTPSQVLVSNAPGFYSLVSGYYNQVPTLLSSLDPSHTNFNEIIPYAVTPTSPVTSLTVEIKNLSLDYPILLKSTNTMLGERVVWASATLDATRSFTVDLPTNECVEIFVHNGATNPPGAEESLGTLCASGVMPKEIIYSANLAFTFWTLPFGASHTFSETGDILTTRVRSDTSPFDYTVKVYHANGTLYNSTTYSGVTTNSTTFDLQTFNSSGATYPSRIEIYDDNGALAYYASIGFPNYFSSVSSFFAQWFTVEGFNLLYMLPIIFAAMFTRNTVGIGSGLTVVLISMLAWLGLIPIDEIIIYLMIFISVMGLLAYRTLR